MRLSTSAGPSGRDRWAEIAPPTTGRGLGRLGQAESAWLVASPSVIGPRCIPLLQAEMSRLAAVSFLELYPQPTADLPPELLPRNAPMRFLAEYVTAYAHQPITSNGSCGARELVPPRTADGFNRALGTPRRRASARSGSAASTPSSSVQTRRRRASALPPRGAPRTRDDSLPRTPISSASTRGTPADGPDPPPRVVVSSFRR